jgi:hypothetical protein
MISVESGARMTDITDLLYRIQKIKTSKSGGFFYTVLYNKNI